MNWIKQYNKERDKAVKSLNVAEFRKFYKKWQERGFYQVSLVLSLLISFMRVYRQVVRLSNGK